MAIPPNQYESVIKYGYVGSTAVELLNPLRFIKPNLLEYSQEIQSDKNLQIQIKHVPDDLDISNPVLKQFQIGYTVLTFCNFSPHLLRVDDSCTLYVKNRPLGTYSRHNCHTTFYPVNHYNDSEIYLGRLEKDDHRQEMTRTTFVLTPHGWMPVPGPDHVIMCSET